MSLSSLLRSAALAALCTLSTLAQDAGYQFSTLAGRPFFGSADGAGGAAGFSGPKDLATDKDGNVYVADSANNTIRKITPAGVVTTLAGLVGTAGSADGTGSAARFNTPYGITVDVAGQVYVTDIQNHTIRKISPSGEVRTLAGLAGMFGSEDGTGSAARFNFPAGLSVDQAGNVFVADSQNHTIRKISPAGVVTTLAGNPARSGSTDGAAHDAQFSFPVSAAADRNGNVYVVDILYDSIRKISATGVVTTVAGMVGNGGYADGLGSAARFSIPLSAAVDRAGNLYIADSNNQLIRRMTPAGEVTTIAGQPSERGDANGAAREAQFNQPAGVTVDDSGNVFVSDSNNNTIRKITPAGAVTNFAGGGSTGADDDAGSAARFNRPDGVAVDLSGNTYVADALNRVVRKISPAGAVSTFAGKTGEIGSTDGIGSAARFTVPRGVAVDRAGNVFVTDMGACTIRRITPAGLVTTIAGSPGEAGDADGQGAAARFFVPNGIVVAADGTLYVADQQNSTIRKITPAGLVSTLAGVAGQAGGTDGVGRAARFVAPMGLALDSGGNLFVADGGAFTIRKISPAGNVTTIAGQHLVHGLADGTGKAAQFNAARGIAIDPLNTIFVADGNNLIRQISTTGVVTTVVAKFGNYERFDGRPGDRAVYFATSVATDLAGNLYIGDNGNNTVRKAVSTTKIINLSVRTQVGSNDDAPILGFVVSGGGAKNLLVRGIGPTLATFGVPAVAPDPLLSLFDQGGTLLQQNDDWGGSAALHQAFDSIGSFPLPDNSKDSALLATVSTGAYSARVTTTGNTGRDALIEIYDLERTAPSRLINASIRTSGGSFENTRVAGFVLTGSAPKTLLIRAAGPSLAKLGLSAASLLADPKLTLYEDTTPLASNDDWGGTPELKAVSRTVGAFDFDSDTSKDAAVLVTLVPGVYTVQVTGSAGRSLIEIYEVP